MLLDLRIYTYLPAKFRRFLKTYEEIGFDLTTKHLGRTLGIFRSDSGTMNQTFQFFVYDDADHRDHCRHGMLADPAWAEFVKIDGDALITQRNELLVPTDFSPLSSRAGSWPEASTPARVFELRRWRVRPDAMAPALDALRHAQPSFEAVRATTIATLRVIAGAESQIVTLAAFPDTLTRNRAQDDLANPTGVLANLRQHVTGEDSTLLLPMPYSPLR